MKKQINGMYAQINEHKNFLRETDYKAIKQAETDYRMSDEELEERQFARDEINRLEYEVGILEEALEEARAEQPEEEGL